MSLPPSVQPWEIWWSASSLVGIAFQSWGFIDSVIDRRELRASGRNGPRLITADNNVYNQFSMCVVHAMFLMTGIVAMTQVPVVSHAPLTITTILITVAIFAANLILVLNSIRSRVARRQLIVYFDRIDAEREAAEPPPITGENIAAS